MTEQEKKAIEFTKYYIKEYFFEEIAIQDDFDFKDSITIILNLITKQQEEIGRHKMYKTYYEEQNEVNKKFISKETIRKIKANTDTRYDFTEEVLKLL